MEIVCLYVHPLLGRVYQLIRINTRKRNLNVTVTYLNFFTFNVNQLGWKVYGLTVQLLLENNVRRVNK